MKIRPLPAFVINGLTVAVGIGLVHACGALLGGAHIAQLALSGAVCASLADQPTPPHRTAYRVGAAGLLGVLAAAMVGALAGHPVALGLGIAATVFVAMMTMAWGPRAGAVSFAPILSIVFSMAAPPVPGTWPASVAWHATGALAYLLWALACAALLQRRYRRLAVADAMAAAADLLGARAALLDATATADPGLRRDAMRGWVQAEAALAERLQQARDFAFADAGRTPRDAALLLRTIELRDQLLASRLDIDRIGPDEASRWLLRQTAGALRVLAGGLEAVAADARRRRTPAAGTAFAERLAAEYADAPMPADDPRQRLLPSLRLRLRTLGDSVDAAGALLRDAAPPLPPPPPLPLTPEQLARFVAPEGWPASALAAHWRGHSPVLRHAVRSTLALGSAYFIALALPWASHPHWLVLSVAVVLRGNLEQTLGRRNARVGGTLLGCVVVVALSGVHSTLVLGGIFLVAVGTAHAFVLRRYWLTACAATVMALLQAHAVDPAAGFSVAERVADTLLGAALAWAFSYVLPSWERRQLPAAVRNAMTAIDDYARHALRLPPADAVEPRLARRRAYDALQALAGTVQRSAAEPRSQQVPVAAVATLLDLGQRLMALLSVVRLILVRGGDRLHAADSQQALRDTLDALHAALDPATLGAATAAVPEASGVAVVPPGNAAGALDVGAGDAESIFARLPPADPGTDPMAWLRHRLRDLAEDGRRLRVAAASAIASRPG